MHRTCLIFEKPYVASRVYVASEAVIGVSMFLLIIWNRLFSIRLCMVLIAISIVVTVGDRALVPADDDYNDVLVTILPNLFALFYIYGTKAFETKGMEAFIVYDLQIGL